MDSTNQEPNRMDSAKTLEDHASRNRCPSPATLSTNNALSKTNNERAVRKSHTPTKVDEYNNIITSIGYENKEWISTCVLHYILYYFVMII